MKRARGNRGKPFELNINRSNITYAAKHIAYIEKVEPPFKVRGKYGRAFLWGNYEKKGFADYFGVYQGKAVAFEAKSTTSETSFPLKNINQNQIEVLRSWHHSKGLAFFLIEFEVRHQTFFLTFDQVNEWWVNQFREGRKSIPYPWIVDHGKVVTSKNGVVLDYLDCLA